MRKIRTTKLDAGPCNKKLLSSIVIMSSFGLIMVLDASSGLATGSFGQYHFFVLQLIWILTGSILGFIAYKIDYHIYKKISLPLLLITVLLLCITLVKGTEINGARRWITIGQFTLQSSEIAKLALILYLATWLDKPLPHITEKIGYIKFIFKTRVIPFLIFTFIIAGLVVIGKDLGTAAIIIFIAISMFFASGRDIGHTINTLFIFAISLVLVGIAIVIQPYRVQRLLTFTNYNADPQNQGYQIHQILLTITQGGVFGIGFAQSIEKANYLVQSTAITDSIFAIIAEELGFVGCCIIFLLFGYILWEGFLTAIRAPDNFGKLTACGIVTWLFIQFFLNIGANIVLVPLTGVPLPFISYGGSSTIILLIAIGILLNISRFNERT